jgi:hypothetical protein
VPEKLKSLEPVSSELVVAGTISLEEAILSSLFVSFCLGRTSATPSLILSLGCQNETLV